MHGKWYWMQLWHAMPVWLVVAVAWLATAIRTAGSAATAETATPFIIRNDQDMYNALADNSVQHCLIVQDIRLSNEVFPGGAQPLFVRRNVTFVGQRTPDGDLPVLNFDFIQGRVKMLPGVTLIWTEVIFKNSRVRPGLSADLFLGSPGAELWGKDNVVWLYACMPPNIPQFLAHQRAEHYPGQQRVSWVKQPFCIKRRCWPDYMLFEDYSAKSVAPALEGADEGGYDLVRINTTRVCDEYITDECMQLKGVDVCMYDVLQRQRQQQSQPSSTTVILLAVLLPVAGVACFIWLFVNYLKPKAQQAQLQLKQGAAASLSAPPPDDLEAAIMPGKARLMHAAQQEQKLARADAADSSSTGACSDLSSGDKQQCRAHIQSVVNQLATGGQMFQLNSTLCFLHGYKGTELLSQDDLPDIQLGPLLGAGCFGKVYLATLHGQQLAVKVLEYDLRAAPRVQNELEFCSGLKHANVASTIMTLTFATAAAKAALAAESWHILLPGSAASTAKQRQQQQQQAGSRESSTPAPSQSATSSSAQPAPLQIASAEEQPEPEYVVMPVMAQRNLAELPPASSETPRLADPRSLVSWLVMGYCNQGTLWSLLAKCADEPISAKLPLLVAKLLDVARGMAYIHSKGICHGDLKAANVLVASEQSDRHGCVAKVADFGLSRALAMGASHLSTRTYGTVTHMAPELLASGHLRQASDVFSFGILIYEVISGQQHYQGMLHGEIIHKVIIERKRPQLPAEVPEQLCQLAADSWSQEPEARPSFSSIEGRLEAMLRGIDALVQEARQAERAGAKLGAVADF